jgi:hypothetical protein
MDSLKALAQSLVFDGRFYGAEWQEELDDYSDYIWWIFYGKQKFFKNLGIVYS